MNPQSQQLGSGAGDFRTYLDSIIHEWLKTLTALAFTLVPAFFILDYFTMPKDLLPLFGIYRLGSTLIVLVQAFVIRHTRPGPFSYVHAYIVSLNVGGMIALMTTGLGGFNSSYYAGLNLVIIGVNLLLPWKALHSAINSLIILAMYVSFNLAAGEGYSPSMLVNNLFFLSATSIIAVSINHVRHKLVENEFLLLTELKKARDALWSEMEIAKRIQTALLPGKEKISGYEIAAVMHPAKEVGGDYYDIIETPLGDKWIAMGDVSGHGVDSGLIMMMAQTCILSKVNTSTDCTPSEVLESVNTVIRENILRLGSDYYMTMLLIRLNGSKMTIAGKHQDIIVHRAAWNRTESIPTSGTWLGIADRIGDYLEESTETLEEGDILLLFTDGITEAANFRGEMYGQRRLEQALGQYADLPVKKLLHRILDDVKAFQGEQMDDMTLVVVKKCSDISRLQ